MTKRAPPEIPLEELRKRFHLPLAEVAKEFGVCMTFIKKVCRAAGIKRWPYRKIKSLQNKASKLSALRACHAAKAVEKHVESIRELTGRASTGLEDFEDDMGDDGMGLSEEDEEGDDEGQAIGQEVPLQGSSRGERGRPQNPALLRRSADEPGHPYTSKGPATQHSALREALLGCAPQQPPNAPPAYEHDPDDLCAQSDLAFEELWSDGLWSMPSPVSALVRGGVEGPTNARRMPRVGSAGRLDVLDEDTALPRASQLQAGHRPLPRVGSSGRLRGMEEYAGMARSSSYERLHDLGSLKHRDRSFDRLDSIHDRVIREDGHLGRMPRTMSGEHLARVGGGIKAEAVSVKDEQGPEEHPLAGLRGEHQVGGMRRNTSSGSLGGGMRRNLSSGSLGGEPAEGGVLSMNQRYSIPRSGSQNSLNGMDRRMPLSRDPSHQNLARMDSAALDEFDAECLLGDTVFVF